MCLFSMFSETPLNLQYINKKSSAIKARKAIVTGTGKSIYLPKAPEVLTKSMATFISKRWLM